jgi:hypothetical protein
MAVRQNKGKKRTKEGPSVQVRVKEEKQQNIIQTA